MKIGEKKYINEERGLTFTATNAFYVTFNSLPKKAEYK